MCTILGSLLSQYLIFPLSGRYHSLQMLSVSSWVSFYSWFMNFHPLFLQITSTSGIFLVCLAHAACFYPQLFEWCSSQGTVRDAPQASVCVSCSSSLWTLRCVLDRCASRFWFSFSWLNAEHCIQIFLIFSGIYSSPYLSYAYFATGWHTVPKQNNSTSHV